MDKQSLINEYAELLGKSSANAYFEAVAESSEGLERRAQSYGMTVEQFKDAFTTSDITKAHKTLGRIVEAIEARDLQALKDRLWYDNKISRKFFTAYTGVELGKTDKSMRLAIDQWAAQGVLV